MPAVALRSLTHTLICNHISHTDGRHVRKGRKQAGISSPSSFQYIRFVCSAAFSLFCVFLPGSAALGSFNLWSKAATEQFFFFQGCSGMKKHE